MIEEAPASTSGDIIGTKLAPFNPSHEDVIAISLDLMQLQADDVLYDLGCGDGRVLVKACQRFPGLQAACGVEYDHAVYLRAVQLMADHQLTNQVRLVHDNVLNVDFSSATAVFVYLLPEGMKLLKDRFLDVLARGGRIVSYVFSIPGVEPSQMVLYKSSTKIYLYKR